MSTSRKRGAGFNSGARGSAECNWMFLLSATVILAFVLLRSPPPMSAPSSFSSTEGAPLPPVNDVTKQALIDAEIASWKLQAKQQIHSKHSNRALTRRTSPLIEQPREHRGASLSPSHLSVELQSTLEQHSSTPKSIKPTQDAQQFRASLFAKNTSHSPDTVVSSPLLTRTAAAVADALIRDAHKKNVVFIKTYKTGSTTVAMFLNAIAYQLRMKMLHPEDKGWFAPGELARRGARGEQYGVSFRHITPHLNFDALDILLPQARYVTILREPVSRFVSLFNFVGNVLRAYRKAEVFVGAVKQQQAKLGDANSFCNNMAWVVSGRPESKTFAYISPGDESVAAARAVVEELEKRGVIVLLSHRMTESLLLLSNVMNWDLKSGALQFKSTSERVQSSKKYQCRGGPESSCHKAILSCNGVDQALYSHYASVFDIQVATAGIDQSQVQAFNKKSQRASGEFTRKYPINCKKTKKDTFEKLHACG